MEQNKTKTYKLLSILTIFFFAIFLTGCGGKFKKERELKGQIKDYFPNTKVTKVTAEIGKEKTYHCENSEFLFVVTNEIEKDTMFPFIKYSNVYTTYHLEMVKNKEKEIKEIANKCGIGCYFVYNDTWNEEKEEKDFYNTVVFLNDGSSFSPNQSFVYEFYITNGNDIKKCCEFLKEVEELLKSYYPKQNEKYLQMSQEIKFLVHDNNLNDKQIEYRFKNLLNEETYYCNNWKYDYKEMQKIIEYNYFDLLKNNIIKNDGFYLYDEYANNPKYIKNLYINNKPFTSEKYEIEFVFNPIDEQYYTVVCFGKEFEYNGGVKDYLQREIIQKYYKNNEYTIYDNKDTTTYKINGNYYKIEDDIKNEILIFKKDFKTLNIRSYKKIGDVTAGAGYNYFISLEDFATIMEMKIDNVDTINGIISLKTNN